jgi:hypothetical protein
MLRLLVLPAIVAGFFCVTSLSSISLIEGLAACLLLRLPWRAYSARKREPRSRLPFFTIIAFICWIYFALPLFWGDHFGSGNIREATTAAQTQCTGCELSHADLRSEQRKGAIHA